MLGLSKSKVPGTPWYNNASTALNRVLPSLYHDYVGQKFWDSASGETGIPFTATRTTNAMQFDAQGRLIWGPVQLNRRGNDFPNWDSMASDGTIALSGNTAPTGMPAYMVTWTVASPTIGLSYGGNAVTLGTNHTYSIYLRYVNHQWARILLYSGTNSANQCRCWVDLVNKTLGSVSNGGSATGATATLQDVGNGWVRVSITGNAAWANTADASILVSSAGGDTQTARIGNGAAIELSSAIFEPTGPNSPQGWRPEFATTGSAWYGPRFDFDPATGLSRGLLIEEFRTNSVTNSLNLTTATTTAQFGSQINSPATYLGGWSAVRYTGDGTSASHLAFFSTITPGGSTSVSLSAIVAPISGGTFYQITGSGNWMADLNGYANFNLTGSGSITATGASATGAFCNHLGNGVYHIGCTVQSSASPTSGAGPIIGLLTTGTDARLPTNTSTGVLDLIYGCACSGSSGWNSVVPTFGTAASKAADSFSTASGAWLTQGYGTFLVVVSLPTFPASIFPTLLQIDDGTANNLVRIYGSANASNYQVGSRVDLATVSQVNISHPTTASYFSASRFAISYADNNTRLITNGGTVTLDSVCVMPTALTTFRVGRSQAGTGYAMWIREIRYYNNADATDAQLQTLTT